MTVNQLIKALQRESKEGRGEWTAYVGVPCCDSRPVAKVEAEDLTSYPEPDYEEVLTSVVKILPKRA